MPPARRIFLYTALTLVTFVLVFPFLWMISTSLKHSSDIFTATPQWIPKSITFSHYIELWTKTPFPLYFRNSLIVTLATNLVTLLIATFLAYGLSRFRFRGRGVVLNMLLVSQMFPIVLLIIPIYLLFIKLDLMNTYVSLIISYCTFAIPFATLMLKSYFDTLPPETEEASLIDGCSEFGSIFRIVIPLSAPAIAAVGLFTCILSWQEFIFALTLTNTNEMRTLPVGISLMVGNREVLWGMLMAASTLVTLPVVILFIYFQKYLVSGMTMGAVKG